MTHAVDGISAAVLIVAAGRGIRAGGAPKQYRMLAGEPVLARALRSFLGCAACRPILVVIHPDDQEAYGRAIAGLEGALLAPVPGGATRQASVRAGLEALMPHGPSHVLIHDAARPFVTPAVIGNVREALTRHAGAIPAVPVADTIKRAPSGLIRASIDRTDLYAAQTPQGFEFVPILEAHRAAHAAGRSDFTDDAAIAEWAGIAVAIAAGEAQNRKLTTEEDLAMAEQAGLAGIRVGTGFDVHRLGPGDHVWLGGVRIPHDAGLIGHSDADVALHALTDALLGAIGDGDIGTHFPPSEERWRGAASEVFLRHAGERIAARRGRILNVDLTLLCEAPRIAGHRAAMRARIAAILALAPERVSIKATTTEGLGFTGRREGIAAQACATVLIEGE